MPPSQASESREAYDDYASGSNAPLSGAANAPVAGGLGSSMGGEFDVNRSANLDEDPPF